ncbi:hypothetical protein LUZ60_004508 [Juncus effusus]|nr:hypothetical protein LUZ60_004508 [Juncus effusus]
MEPTLSLSLFLSICLSILLCIIFFKQKKAQKPTLKLPPGPRPLPLIGNLHNLIGSLPHHVMRDLSKQYGPLMLLQMGEIPIVVLSSPEVVREVMKNHDLAFASRPITPSTYTTSYGGKGLLLPPYTEYWRQMRKICITELLSMKRVQSFRSMREEEVGNLIEHISLCSSQSQVVNLSKEMARMVNDVAARVIIGSKCTSQDTFLHALDVVVELMAGFNLADIFPSSWLVRVVTGATRKASRSHQVLDRITEDVIKQIREAKMMDTKGEHENLVRLLLRLYDEGTLEGYLDMESVKAVILDLFMASSETSSTAIEWIMSELIRNPRVMRKAQSEVREILEGFKDLCESDVVKLNYFHQVIKEALRLHPPAPLLTPRLCRETCRIFGYDIPKGATVLTNMWAIGRDPKYWDDPEEFKPERFTNSNVDFKGTDFEFIPFGAGRRMCPGVALGLANVELLLASLLYHFDWELPDGAKLEEIDMSESFGITTRRKTPLKLLAVPYKPRVA